MNEESGAVVVLENGALHYFLDGKRHRDDGPAYIGASGTLFWYRHGKSHRDDGPAVVWSDGQEDWWREGSLHREDGPAIIYANGIKEWYRNGFCHRTDGPAVVFPDGQEDWWLHGKPVPNLNGISTRIQRWYRYRTIRKFIRLLNTDGPFSRWFDSPEGWAGRWRKLELEKFAARVSQ